MDLVVHTFNCSNNNRNFSYSFNNSEIISNNLKESDLSIKTKQIFNTRNIDLCKVQSHETLNKIFSLKDNWNLYGAKHFSIDLIDFVKKLVDKLDSQPDIYPTARDSIQLEYEKSGKYYLEFEIFSSTNIKMFLVLEDCNQQITKKITEKELIEIVKAYYGQ